MHWLALDTGGGVLDIGAFGNAAETRSAQSQK